MAHAEPGNPQSVLDAMDAFWTDVLGVSDPDIEGKWGARGQNIEQKVREASSSTAHYIHAGD